MSITQICILVAICIVVVIAIITTVISIVQRIKYRNSTGQAPDVVTDVKEGISDGINAATSFLDKLFTTVYDIENQFSLLSNQKTGVLKKSTVMTQMKLYAQDMPEEYRPNDSAIDYWIEQAVSLMNINKNKETSNEPVKEEKPKEVYTTTYTTK